MQHGPPELNINLKPANISLEIIQSWNPLFTIVKVKIYVFSAPNMSRHPLYPEYRNVKIAGGSQQVIIPGFSVKIIKKKEHY